MSLSRRLADRFKFAFGADIVAALSGALLAVILARLLNPDAYGLLFLALSVLAIGKLLSVCGIAKSAGRFIAEYKESDNGQIPHILKISFIYNLITIGIVTLFFVFFGNELAIIIGVSELGPLLVFGTLYIAFGTLTTFVTQIYQGFEEIRIASTFKILNKVGRLILAVAFVLTGYQVIGALAGYIFSFAIVSIVGILYLYVTMYRRVDKTPIDTDLKSRIRDYSVPIAFTQSAHIIDNHVDKVLLGFFAGPVAVGFYTIAKQVVQMTQTPMSALGFTLSPTYGAQKSQGNINTATKIFETALSHSLLLYIPAAVGLVLVAEPVVELVFGPDYRGAVPVLQVLSILVVLQSITNLTSNGLDYLGRARVRAVVKAIVAILNVLLNVLLIPLYGAVGAAIATVLTFSLYTFATMVIMHHELGLKIPELLKQIGYTLVVTTFMAIPVLLTVQYVSGFITLIAVVTLGIVAWSLSVLVFGLIDIDKGYKFLSSEGQ